MMISNTSDEQKNVDQIILIDDDEYINDSEEEIDSEEEEIDSEEEEEIDSEEEEEIDSEEEEEIDSDTDTVILEVEEDETNNIGPFPILRRERHVDYLTPVRNSQNHEEVSIVDVSKITSRRRLAFN